MTEQNRLGGHPPFAPRPIAFIGTSGEGERAYVGQVLATPDEIMALCREFPEAPIIEIARHAIAHGAPITRERLAMGRACVSRPYGGAVPPIPSAIAAISAPMPAPNGLAGAMGEGPISFSAAIDAEIARRVGAGAPDALWLDEVLPAYAAGLPPEVAADRILARRDTRSVTGRRGQHRRRRGVVNLLLSGWREWDFRRALRQSGRA